MGLPDALQCEGLAVVHGMGEMCGLAWARCTGVVVGVGPAFLNID